jgi:Domain of unknown function (DUF4124)
MNTSRVVYILFVSLCFTVSVAFAEVYKCTGADGKTSFSDQPCSTGQKVTVIKPQVAAPASAGATVGVANVADYKSRPEYPECLSLKNKISDYLTGSISRDQKQLEAEARQAQKDMARYKQLCGVVDKEGARELQVERDRAEKPQRDAEDAARCQFLRKDLKELRDMTAAIDQSTDRLTVQETKERKQFSEDAKRRIPALEQEIAKSCAKK